MPVPGQLVTHTHIRTDLPEEAVRKVTEAINPLVADTFALYVRPRMSIGTSPVSAFGTCTCFSTSTRTRSSR